MKIQKILVENYRLLKNFCIYLEEELSLVIGKNNTGKTSLLSVLDKFLNPSEKKKFSYNDFNLDFKKELHDLIQNPLPDIIGYKPFGIYLRLFIEYSTTDNLEHISNLMMDLDPNNNYIVLGFEYVLHHNELERLQKEYGEFKAKEAEKKANNNDYEEKDLNFFLDRNATNYFHTIRKTIEYDLTTNDANENNFKDLEKEKISIQNVLNFKFISAKREVSNRDMDKTLSSQTSKLYKKSEESTEQQNAIEDFQEKLIDTDIALSDIYSDLFKEVVDKVKKFGGIKQNESVIKILSTLQHRELLEGNTTVMYEQMDDSLPENYNGLGYMNLISMVFEIEYLVKEFKRKTDEVPADINMLFIEEPEAHTHPQMQYVFIKNIKELLKEGIKRYDGNNRKLQYLISTHSSHIVSESNFDDIKYLKKETENSVVAKNLKDLEKEYVDNGEEENYRFLKQYLTLHRAELFFADKAILIEGDTERILLPAMMKKFENEEKLRHEANGTIDNNLPLLSQNISLIEVGAHAKTYERFIDFVGTKTLIITDIDSVKRDFVRNTDGTIKETKKGTKRTADYACRVAEGEKTSNSTLNFFFASKDFGKIKALRFAEKRFKKQGTWRNDINGHLQLVFQTGENGYHSRSFEDAFFSLQKNIDFIKSNRSKFKGIKNLKFFYDVTKDAFDLAEMCIDSKGSFAVDVLFCSAETNYEDWQIPSYIKEGLTWLKED